MSAQDEKYKELMAKLEKEGEEHEEYDGIREIMQHEFDHLEGCLYIDKLATEWHEERNLMLEERGWGKPGNSWLPGRDLLED